MSSDQLTPTCSLHPFQAPDALRQSPRAYTGKNEALKRISLWKAARSLDTAESPATFLTQAKFFLRACSVRRGVMTAWLEHFATESLAPLLEAHPRLALKPYRAYVTTLWNVRERLAIFRAHYKIAQEIFPANALKKIYTGGIDMLHIVNTATNRRLALRVLYKDQFRCEGELTLALVDTATDLRLAGISFCFGVDDAGARRIYIGGLQACHDPRVRPIIHDLAKEMHGMRAKALVLWCLQQLGATWGVGSIHAIDDEHHFSNSGKKRNVIPTSYDEFWAESDGEHRVDGFWKLPLQLRHRSREELKPNRRKQHERRYAFLNDLHESLQNAVINCASERSQELVDFFYASALPQPTQSEPLAVTNQTATEPEAVVTMAGLA